MVQYRKVKDTRYSSPINNNLDESLVQKSKLSVRDLVVNYENNKT
ncbi:hypothetical protein [Clostridium arbusti]|nr:hypothetical protein [Clostridium arbusti]